MILELLEKSADGVGIMGVVILLIAYYLLNTNKMSAGHLPYQIMNFCGAGFVLFSLCFQWNTASALIEFAWMLVSLIGIYRIFFKSKVD